MRKGLLLLLLVLLTGCSGGANVVLGDGRRIGEIQGEPYNGPLKRIAVAAVLDHTGGKGMSDITRQIGLLTGEGRKAKASDILSGIRDLLTTALFNTNRFILLEREGLDEVIAEQTFQEGNRSLPSQLKHKLEGAELLLLTAVTDFDMGASGGLAFPIPIKLNDHGDFGVLDVEMRTAHVAMDMRLVDVATGRVVATTAVEGSARKFGVAMAGVFSANGGHLRLPGLLSLFNNTPIEGATLEMVDSAAHELVKRAFPLSEEEQKKKDDRELWESIPLG
jgi:curli biogenesis system outer membrane secretion channel CsgG